MPNTMEINKDYRKIQYVDKQIPNNSKFFVTQDINRLTKNKF